MYTSLLIPKKLSPSSDIAASECLSINLCRLFIRDSCSKQTFLIDTGADVSVLPKSYFKQPLLIINDNNIPVNLFAANGTQIKTFGTVILSVNLGLRRNFKWSFVIADVTRAIIGSDFLTHFHILPDLKNKQLVDGRTQIKSQAQITQEPSYNITAILKDDSPFTKLLLEFPDIYKMSNVLQRLPQHTVYHHIETTGSPCHAKARRLDSNKLAAAKKEFEYLLEHGIIRPSKSEWSSALHMVRKKDGTWRCCGDYRQLNKKTIPDRYNIPFLTDCNLQLNGCTIFSTLDMVRAYHQVDISPDDIDKTAVVTPFGLYEYVKMPFGLRNAAQSFQRLMDTVLRGLDFVFCYLDDALIASKNVEEHMEHLRIVFQRFKDHGIILNQTKCIFGVPEVNFLGFKVNSDGLMPMDNKVENIINFPKPKTIQELRQFLAMTNFYRRFLPKAAEVQIPLNAYLQGATKKDKRPVKWTAEAEEAFGQCKSLLANSTLLSHPHTDALLALKVDASNFGIGGVVEQLVNHNWQPLAFFSKKLSPAQLKYSAYDRELLAAYESIRHFRYMLEGRQFILFTDHKPLCFAFNQNPEKSSPRQWRHLDFVGQFTTDIRHVSGRENVVADALSRIQEISAIDYKQLHLAQQNDDELTRLLSSDTNLNLKQYQIPNSNNLIYCDTSTNKIRPFIPLQLRKTVFDTIHGLSHPGAKATRKLVSSRFVWPSMNRDINQWTKNCQPCQSSKIIRHTKSPIGSFEMSTRRFADIHIDIVGPLPQSEGYRYLLTIVDRFTRWPEAIPLKDITSATVCEHLFSAWVSRFGCPDNIYTDRGAQFTSSLFKDMAKFLDAKLHNTTSYHPQANGMVERFHRTLKAALTCHGKIQWTKTLPSVMLGLRSMLKDDLGSSCAELVYGEPLHLPGEFFRLDTSSQITSTEVLSNLRIIFSNLRPTSASNHANQSPFVSKDLSNCSHVWLRCDKTQKVFVPKYSGPYPVVTRTSKDFKIRIGLKEETVTIDRLKPAFIATEYLSSLETSSSSKPTVRFALEGG